MSQVPSAENHVLLDYVLDIQIFCVCGRKEGDNPCELFITEIDFFVYIRDTDFCVYLKGKEGKDNPFGF